MYDILCTYPLTTDLFTQSIHPTEPVIALGLALGHVQLHRLPPLASQSTPVQNGFGTVDTLWRTRRHKGSCRALAFSHDGKQLYSAGTDGIVKIASAETGQVASKIGIPLCKHEVDFPTLLHQLNPSTLLLATDSALLHVYDIRASTSSISGDEGKGTKPAQTLKDIHVDYITSLSPLPTSILPSSAEDTKQFLTTGGTTVAITDIRKGVLKQSENLEEELLSSTICAGKAIVGSEKGRVRVWNVGQWDDSEQSLRVDKMYEAGADVLATMPGYEGGKGRVAVGGGDGGVRFLSVEGGKKQGRVRLEEEVVSHDEMDGVIGLGWVRDGRLVSGGGQSMKIWEERGEEEDGEGEGLDGLDGEVSDDERDGSDDGGNDSEEEPPRKGRKKKKKGKGKKVREERNGILKFKGLD